MYTGSLKSIAASVGGSFTSVSWLRNTACKAKGTREPTGEPIRDGMVLELWGCLEKMEGWSACSWGGKSLRGVDSWPVTTWRDKQARDLSERWNSEAAFIPMKSFRELKMTGFSRLETSLIDERAWRLQSTTGTLSIDTMYPMSMSNANVQCSMVRLARLL